MSVIIINYKKDIKSYYYNFFKKINNIPKLNKNYLLEIILYINNTNKINIFKNNNLNNELFINSIIDWAFLLYNKNKNYIIILINSHFFTYFNLYFIIKLIPTHIKLIIQINQINTNQINTNQINTNQINTNQSQLIKSYINNGFQEKLYLNNIIYLIKKNYSIINLSFSKNCIDFFKLIPLDIISKKEIAGSLHVIYTKNNISFLDIKKETLIIGNETGVDIVQGLYNFHSHPKAAYETNNITLAWPSSQDYIGFLLAAIEDNTICHFVISLEGIYIISLEQYWFDYLQNNQKNKINQIDDIGAFILDKYNVKILDLNNHTPISYLNYVNKITYFNKYIFQVQFLYWKNVTNNFYIKYI